jgi:putative ABC transport system permease protein
VALPLIYNIRSVKARWASNLVAVLGIAGVVAVFVAMLSMARGFKLTLVESGSPGNAIVLRGGATTEMMSALTLDELRVISDAPGVAKNVDGRPLASGEVVVVAAFQHKASGSSALAQVRGVSPEAMAVHRSVRIARGRFLRPGLSELVVGRNAATMYTGFKLGDRPRFGGRTWRVVGIMDSNGSAFDSEVWADAAVLNQTYKRPENIFQSVTVRLTQPSAFAAFKKALGADPRLTVTTEPEREYYAKQSRAVSTMIRVLGFMVAFVMGIGAVFGAFNTMYSAVAARSREIAMLRALGFGGGSVVLSWLLESAFLALIGGLLGCLVVLPINGLTTSTLNFQSFSQIAFAFRITPGLLVQGIVFALFMGLAGGLLPAVRAARMPVAAALREL